MSFFVLDTETFHSEFALEAPLTVGPRSNSYTFVMKNCHWYITSYVSKKTSDYLGIYLQREDEAGDLTIKMNYYLKLISSTDKT